MTDLERISKVINDLYDIQDVARSVFGDEGYNALADSIASLTQTWNICKRGQEEKLKGAYKTPVNNSKKPVKSSLEDDFDEEGNWTGDKKPAPQKREDMHGKFKRPAIENRDRLRPQIEDALDDLMARKKFGLDKEVYDETVEYVIDLFGEEYPPKDAKEAVQEWYADTKRFFPEMFGKGEKRRLASSLYLKKIRSSRMIKSGRR